MSIFAHIIEEGSVSAAADKLDLSKSVVSQHLKTLEQDLGVTLLKRTTRRQILTQMGEQFYLSCKNVNSIATVAWETAQQNQAEPQGRIRITAPHALMDTLVAPVIADLMRQYPKLQPELINDDQHLDVMEHDIDLAIRVGASPDSNLKQKRIGEFRDVLCGTAEMQYHDINSLPYIANSWQGKSFEHKFHSNNGSQLLFTSEANCISNSFHSCLALIQASAGIGIIPDFYLAQMSPKLINLMPEMSLPLNTVYALNSFSNHPPLVIQICVETLALRLTNNDLHQ